MNPLPYGRTRFYNCSHTRLSSRLQILADTGTPQTGDLTKNIGPLPDLQAAYALLETLDFGTDCSVLLNIPIIGWLLNFLFGWLFCGLGIIA